MTVSFQDTDLATPAKTLVVGSDTIGGIDYQRIKVVWGTTGTATELTTSAGLPVQVTAQSSAFNVTTTPSSQITVANSSSTAVIGSVLPSSQWTVTTVPSSQAIVSVTPTTQFTVTTVPSSQATVSVTPTTQFTVTTTPSSNISVNLTSATIMIGCLSSSTSTATVPVIGAVQSSTQWTVSVTPTTQFTVTTTPSSQITASVTPSSQWTVSTTPSSQITASVTPTSAISVNNNTSTGVIGAVMPSTQWTVSVTPTTQFTVTTTPSSQITVANSSSTAVIGSVMASSVWLVDVSADVGTIMSSGVAQTPLYHTVVASATGLTAITTAVASKVQVLLSIAVTNGSATVPAQFSLRGATSSTTLLGVTALAANGSIVLPYNPIGWATTTTSEALNINVASTGTPVIGGALTFVAI